MLNYRVLLLLLLLLFALFVFSQLAGKDESRLYTHCACSC